MNPDGSGKARLTDGPAKETEPHWSPDGRKLAYTSQDGTGSDIFVMNSDGSGKTRLTNNTKGESVVAWSPEGDKILVVADDPPANPYDSEMCIINADGSGRRCLVDLAFGEIFSVAWAGS